MMAISPTSLSCSRPYLPFGNSDHERWPAPGNPESRLGGVICPWNETEPGSKVASSLERRHRWRRGLDRRGGDRTNPRHALKTDRHLIVLGEPPEPFVERSDFDIKARNMIEISLSQLPHQRMH
jgi:hypothetical protein